MKARLRCLAVATVAVAALTVSPRASAQKAESTKVAPDAITKARTLDRWGDRSGALRILAARVEETPADADARLLLGTMLLEEGRLDDARRELTQVPETSAKRNEAQRALVQVELLADEPERARELANEALKREPSRRDLLVQRARASLTLGSLNDARHDIDHVLAGDPHDAEARDLRRRVGAAATLRQILLSDEGQAAVDSWLPALVVALPLGLTLALLESAKPDQSTAPRNGDLVAHARALGQRGDRKGALELLGWHLEATPRDSDARTLQATILSWEGRYDEARADLARVLEANPGHSDALRVAVRIELWSDHPARAEELATQALERDNDATDLLLDRSRARSALGKRQLARADLDRVHQIDPANADVTKLTARLEEAARLWAIGASYTFDAFSDGRSPWHEATLSGKRATPWGSVIVRGYEAWRFDTTDTQLELETYPKIREGTYANVALAFSPVAELYPTYRLQADLYQSLPYSFEASLGYRHLQFGSGVNIAVISVSKYLGDWFFTVRSFITPGAAGASVSVAGSARRYLLDSTAYVGLRYGYGISKEEVRSVNDTALLGANTVGAEASIILAGRFDLGLRGSVSQDARVNRPDLWQYDLGTSAGFRF